jgi:hypothetical protein
MHRAIRIVVVAAVTGFTAVSVGWAAAGIAPVDLAADLDPHGVTGGLAGSTDGTLPGVETQHLDELVARASAADPERPGGPPAHVRGRAVPSGQVLVGTSVVDITPAPPAGETWQTEGCATGIPNEALLQTRKTTTPDCIYMGGRGLGPSEPITRVDPANPLEVRTVSIGDADDMAVLTQVDGVYWHGRYDSLCDRCGALDIAEELADELDLPVSSFFIAANHSHNSPDFIGAWGGAPEWYMDQVGDAIRRSIREAVGSAHPAVLQAEEAFTRSLNVQRRGTYWSAEDAGFSWARALAVNPAGKPTDRTLAVISTFSAHPVTSGYDGGRGHADWPGRFSQLVRERDDAVGIAFVAGLGNMSTRQGTEATAEGLYALLPPVRDRAILADTDVATAQVSFQQPMTNLGLIALRTGLFFDRTTSGPASMATGKSSDRACRSASAVSVDTVVSAARIGPRLLITAGPGELFSNLTNTLKDQHPQATVLPLANVNDGLGYIMQSFEEDALGRQVLGFTDAPVEYEEAFSLDSCFGDAVLESSLGLLRSLTADE